MQTDKPNNIMLLHVVVMKFFQHIFQYSLCSFQVLRDVPKARREIDLHWRASGCRHIVKIIDVYENVYGGQKCLLVVMEW